jgi:hypothetical protein
MRDTVIYISIMMLLLLETLYNSISVDVKLLEKVFLMDF